MPTHKLTDALRAHQIDDDGRTLTITEVSRRLNAYPRLVHEMIARGDLIAIMPPGGVRRRILESSVERVIARMRTDANMQESA